jgi:hypothetical protein
MKTLDSWSAFEQMVSNVYASFDKETDDNYPAVVSRPVFRGQANREWKLETTLERFFSDSNNEFKYSARTYHALMEFVLPHIESLTELRWDLSNFDSTERSLLHSAPDGCEFMAYLRHHGFPSPLLDWTQSPYIAAFFALNTDPRDKNATHASIYVFQEHLGRGKCGRRDEPWIAGIGPCMRTHKRHYLQQSEYTICRQEIDGGIKYISHEVILHEEKSSSQDRLVKFDIPLAQKQQFLEKLDQMNINAYSLFSNEDSLMAVLAQRHKKAFSP